MTMKKYAVALGLVLMGTAALFAADNVLTPEEKAQGWVLLFDGKTLDGWEPVTSQWKVVDGAIAGYGDMAGRLASKGISYSDFVLKVDFRAADEHANSGVFIRVPAAGGGGYEVQIFDAQAAGYNTGSVNNVGKAIPFKFAANQWNTYEITADGDHYMTRINGKLLLDVKDVNEKRFLAGGLGLQYNMFPIEFKNIKIRPIKH